MTTVRALPLITRPAQGEALDSWLHAIAVRHNTSLNALYRHMGLDTVADLRTRVTAGSVSEDDAQRIAAATGLMPMQVHAMTLAHYLASVSWAQEATADLTATTPRHHGGWRFCPHCLGASGGTWLLQWRLMWSFACLQHRCLLAEYCPRCGRRQRAPQPLNAAPPRPVHCAHPSPTAAGRNRLRCDADLADTPVTMLEAGHPTLLVQQVLVELLAADSGRCGLYAQHPTPVRDVLADIRILGRGILSATAGRYLEDLLPAELAAQYRRQRHSATAPMSSSVLTCAAAITAAVTVLSRPDLGSAAALLAALPEEVSRYVLHRWTYLDLPAGPSASPVLQALHVTALGDRLSPVAQLQCRLGSAFPRLHATDAQRQQRLVRALPTALWPGWALRLSPPALAHSSSRTVLAAAVLLVGSDLDIAEAAACLGGDLGRLNAIYLLWRLKESPHWPAIRDALAAVSDYLSDESAPIDYARRRDLDYRGLLAQDQWDRICASLGHQRCSAAHPRSYLQHQIRGTTKPRAGPDGADTELREFPGRLTPQLSRALHRHATKFLANQGVQDEPVVWEPPTSIVAGLTLPGVELGDIDIAELHRLIRVDRRTIAATSQQLEVSADLIRYALQQHPAPALPRPPRTPRIGARRPGRVYQQAAEALPRERLVALYSQEQRSLADIAALTGFSKPTLSQLMHDYAIPLRPSGPRPTKPVDPDWLYTEYIVRQRSCADLARELHIRCGAVAAQAATLGMPVRTVTRHTDAELRDNPKIPAILIPALAGHGGWERLQRFAVIAQFSTLTDAGKHLGRGVAVTGHHISRLEKDFRARLLIQKPLRCTDFGEDVLAAVHRLAELGGP
ncbi:TniQ family protein [uncultured Mycolicibacterium sp.]|uniref:TniQ family protein n=1 Tax=uncultured Mycolicibacterium sp. TaxID=2320817 RepID=UPI0032B257BE